MSKYVSLAHAKATLSECVREAEKVPAEDAAQLERLRKAGPEGGLASLAGGWKGSDELADLVEETVRTRPRDGATLSQYEE